MNRDELQRLRDLPIEEVAERLGIEVRRHKALCPFHQDRHPSLSFHTGRNTYRCFVCGAHGGPIDLAMQMLHTDFRDACEWLGGQRSTVQGSMVQSSMVQGSMAQGSMVQGSMAQGSMVQGLRVQGSMVQGSMVQGSRVQGSMVQGSRVQGSMVQGSMVQGSTVQGSRFKVQSTGRNAPLDFEPKKYAKYFERPILNAAARQFLFDERRLDPRVVRWCRLSTWHDRHGNEWLQIPYYDQQRRLIGIQNRNLTGTEPRFRFPQGSRCTIYNLPVLSLLREGEPLYITEGCSDCWAMLSAGRKAIAIPSATLLNPQDISQLQTLNTELRTPFHMYPDRDAPGERLFLQLKELLPNLEHHQLPHGCKDYSEAYLTQFD